MSNNAEKHDAHKDECKHKVTNYCKPCDEFYCLGCEVTWTVTPCAENHYPWWNYTCGTCSTGGTGTFNPPYTTVTTYGEELQDGGHTTVSNDAHADHFAST